MNKKTITVHPIPRLDPRQKITEYANAEGVADWFKCPYCKNVLHKRHLEGTLHDGGCKSCCYTNYQEKWKLKPEETKICEYCHEPIEGVEKENEKQKYHTKTNLSKLFQNCALLIKQEKIAKKKKIKKNCAQEGCPNKTYKEHCYKHNPNNYKPNHAITANIHNLI